MSEIVIGQGSWHYRMYTWWKERSEFDTHKPAWFRENLCHYMRVVLLWAPLGWFFKANVWKGFRPWLITAVLAAILSVGYCLVNWPMQTLFVLALMAVVTVFVLAIIGAMALDDYLKNRFPKFYKRFWLVLLAPLWIPLGVLFMIFYHLVEDVIAPLYFRRHQYLVHTWLGSIVAFLVGFRLIFGQEAFDGLIMFLLAIAVCLVAALVLLLVVYLLAEGVKALIRRWKASRGPQVLVAESIRPGISTKQLFSQFAKTKTGSRICPFITLPHQELMSSAE